MARLKPHLIMCNLHRSKLDANRPLTTAAEVWINANIFLIFTAMMNDTETKHYVWCIHHHQITENQDPLGQQVYAEYHAYLESAKTEIGRGLLLDLHGQNHQQNSIGGTLLSFTVHSMKIVNILLVLFWNFMTMIHRAWLPVQAIRAEQRAASNKRDQCDLPAEKERTHPCPIGHRRGWVNNVVCVHHTPQKESV